MKNLRHLLPRPLQGGWGIYSTLMRRRLLDRPLEKGNGMDPVELELREVTAQWDRAMIENDPEAIGRFMADDWVIVGSDGSIGGKDRFLALIGSGDLVHNVMETHEMEVRVYGDTAVTVASGVSGGHYREEPFLHRERSSCVFVRQGGAWRCVLTHLSSLPEEIQGDSH